MQTDTNARRPANPPSPHPRMDATGSRGSDEPTDSECCEFTDTSVFLERITEKQTNGAPTQGAEKQQTKENLNVAFSSKELQLHGRITEKPDPRSAAVFWPSEISTLESAAAHGHEKL